MKNGKGNGLMAALGMSEGDGESAESSGDHGSMYDADAKMLKRALDAGDGKKAYSVVKGWILDCLEERESESEGDTEDAEAGY